MQDAYAAARILDPGAGETPVKHEVIPDRTAVKNAFDVEYARHADDKRFLDRLENQRADYLRNEKQSRAPCFAAVQSSGYGKSRMIDNFLKREEWVHSGIHAAAVS
mmetsp:Transcript_25/g.51  ORF Transcript_25/g.51 Transcript_25/m.51 type:complete len:106 (+) Transcript_25:361-678(+)